MRGASTNAKQRVGQTRWIWLSRLWRWLGAAASDVVRAAQNADKALIAGVLVFDVFHGGSLGGGRKSLGLEVTIQPRERTLTDQEIEALSAKIVAAVNKATGGELRK